VLWVHAAPATLEFVVRRRLAQEGASLAGLYAGNPQRATTQPTTERLLEAFQEITLTMLVEPHQTRRHTTALSALQQRVLALLELSATIYSNLCEDSSEPRKNERTVSTKEGGLPLWQIQYRVGRIPSKPGVS